MIIADGAAIIYRIAMRLFHFLFLAVIFILFQLLFYCLLKKGAKFTGGGT
jgi:hypothetical protein